MTVVDNTGGESQDTASETVTQASPPETVQAPPETVQAPPPDEETQSTPVATSATPVHTVQPDETLESIATKYNMSPGDLFALNQLVLDGAASARGLGNSENGRILFTGTALLLQGDDSAPSGNQGGIAGQISALAALHTSGSITDDEFNSAKAALLARL